MTIVPTDNLKQDMVLSEDVKDVTGRLLFRKGHTIETKHIKILKKWGITEVNILGKADIEEESEFAIDSQLMKEITEDTKRDFKYLDLVHPAVSELFRLSVLFRSQGNTKKRKRHITPPECENFTDEIRPDVAKKIMQHEIKLPELPSIVHELNEIIEDPLSSNEDIARIVSKSPSLTAVLLKIANSSFFGFPSKIDSISRAVTIIGTKEISTLALGISAIKVFEGIPEDLLDMDDFLRHSFACGIISRILAAQKALPQTEQLFVSGLLHDIGRMIVFKYFPLHARALVKRSFESGKLLYQEEKDCLGCRHTDIASFLLMRWKLPFSLENTISCLHNPSDASDPVQATIVHMADIISSALQLGSSGERFVPPLDYKSWDSLELPPSCFSVVIRGATSQLSAFESFLE